MRFSAKVIKFLKDESGPTAVEYAIMLALLIIAMMQSIRLLGEGANSTFERTNAEIENLTQ